MQHWFDTFYWMFRKVYKSQNDNEKVSKHHHRVRAYEDNWRALEFLCFHAWAMEKGNKGEGDSNLFNYIRQLHKYVFRITKYIIRKYFDKRKWRLEPIALHTRFHACTSYNGENFWHVYCQALSLVWPFSICKSHFVIRLGFKFLQPT